jgi:galactonate dehydratase
VRITDIETLVVEVTERGDWVFVLVHTDAGITGLGEASHSLNDLLLVTAVQGFAERLIGQDPLAIRSNWRKLVSVHAGRVLHTAVSAIEQALWDILGQHLGVPIHALLGGAVRDRIRLYANINRHIRDRSPDGFASAARLAVDEGFTALKVAPFDELRAPDHVRTGPHATWQRGIERVRAVRDAVGPEVELAVDCHGRMEASEAIAVARTLADCRLLWYEEPVRHVFPDQLARVSAAAPMPTASAEGVFAVEGFRPFLLDRVVDVLMPDVKHCGGIQELVHIAEAARLKQLLVAPHNPSGPVATVATAHACVVIPNLLVLEYAWGEVDWRRTLIRPQEPIEDGYLVVSNEPGLGYSLDMDTVLEHRRAAPTTMDSTRVRA